MSERHEDRDPASGPEKYDVTESDQSTEGEMGVSSEREGPTGPGQHGTTGVRPTGAAADAEHDHSDEEPPPEQSAGGPETNPEGIPPKAGYPSLDPRSKDS